MVLLLWGSSGSPREKLSFQHIHPTSAYDVLWGPEAPESYWLYGLWSLSPETPQYQWEKSQRVWPSVKSSSTKGREAGALFCYGLPRNHRRGKPHWQVDQVGHGRRRCPGFAGFQERRAGALTLTALGTRAAARGTEEGCQPRESDRQRASGNSLVELSISLRSNTF